MANRREKQNKKQESENQEARYNLRRKIPSSRKNDYFYYGKQLSLGEGRLRLAPQNPNLDPQARRVEIEVVVQRENDQNNEIEEEKKNNEVPMNEDQIEIQPQLPLIPGFYVSVDDINFIERKQEWGQFIQPVEGEIPLVEEIDDIQLKSEFQEVLTHAFKSSRKQFFKLPEINRINFLVEFHMDFESVNDFLVVNGLIPAQQNVEYLFSNHNIERILNNENQEDTGLQLFKLIAAAIVSIPQANPLFSSSRFQKKDGNPIAMFNLLALGSISYFEILKPSEEQRLDISQETYSVPVLLDEMKQHLKHALDTRGDFAHLNQRERQSQIRESLRSLQYFFFQSKFSQISLQHSMSIQRGVFPVLPEKLLQNKRWSLWMDDDEFNVIRARMSSEESQSMEQLSNYLQLSKFDVILCLSLLVRLVQVLQSSENYSLLEAFIQNQFLPHSYKDIAQNPEAELANTDIKPIVAMSAFNLILLTKLLFNVGHVTRFKGHRKVSVKTLERLYNNVSEILAHVQLAKSLTRHFQNVGVQQKLTEFYIPLSGQQIFKLPTKLEMTEFNPTRERDAQVRIQQIQNRFMNKQAQFYWDGDWIREIAVECERQRELILGLNPDIKMNVEFFVSILVYFYMDSAMFVDGMRKFNPEADESIDREIQKKSVKRVYQQITFRFADVEKLGGSKSRYTIFNLFSQAIGALIQENMVKYDAFPDDEERQLSYQAANFETLSIERIRINTLTVDELIGEKHSQLLCWGEKEERFVYYHQVSQLQGRTRLVAFYRGAMDRDQDYVDSQLIDYIDSDDYTCCFCVFAYFWSRFKQREHSQASMMTALASPEYQNFKDAVENNDIAGVYERIKKFFSFPSLVLYFPQTNILYGQSPVCNQPWVLFKLAHAWVGNGDILFKRHALLKTPQQQICFQLKPGGLIQRHKQNNKIKETLIFYDIETVQRQDESKMRPILVCYEIYSEKFQEFRKGSFFGLDCMLNFAQFLVETMQKQERRWHDELRKSTDPPKILVYAHNGAKFDHLFLQKEFLALFPREFHFIGQLNDIKYACLMGRIVLRDSALLMPAPLKKLAISLQTEHRKMEFDAGAISEEQIENSQEYREKLFEYCHLDVTVLKEVLFKFFQGLQDNIKGFTFKDIKQTLPSTALHVFQKFFLKEKIYGNPPSVFGINVQTIERESYFGGYTQVFNHQILKDGAYFDFVSMYVSILIECNFPLSQGSFETDPEKIQKVQVDSLYIITYFQFEEDTPLTNFPVREEKSHVTIYPLEFKSGDAGLQHVCLWGREILLAQRLGILKQIVIQRRIKYLFWSNIFQEYMLKFFEMKRHARDNPVQKFIAKLFGNSLYGKFGQNNIVQREVMSRAEAVQLGIVGLEKRVRHQQLSQFYAKKSGLLKNVRDLNEALIEIETQVPSSELDSPGSLIRVASFVTAEGRSRLISLIYEIGARKVFYCDTDSIVFRGDQDSIQTVTIGDNHGMIADAIGGARITEGYFISPKCYGLKLDKPYEGKDTYVRFKGVKNQQFDQIKQLFYAGSIRIKQDQWRRDWQGVGIQEVEKEIFARQKRNVQNDGTSKPFLNFQQYEEIKDKSLYYNSETNLFSYL